MGEVVGRVNDTRYGLCASVWSQNVGRVHRVSQQLEVGTVWSNCWLVKVLECLLAVARSQAQGWRGPGTPFRRSRGKRPTALRSPDESNTNMHTNKIIGKIVYSSCPLVFFYRNGSIKMFWPWLGCTNINLNLNKYKFQTT